MARKEVNCMVYQKGTFLRLSCTGRQLHRHRTAITPPSRKMNRRDSSRYGTTLLFLNANVEPLATFWLVSGSGSPGRKR
jgi:hypothetical protein